MNQAGMEGKQGGEKSQWGRKKRDMDLDLNTDP